MVTRSSTEAKYRSMASTCCEVIWLKSLLTNFGVIQYSAINLYYDNLSATYICKNSIFHERTKHIKMGCHFI